MASWLALQHVHSLYWLHKERYGEGPGRFEELSNGKPACIQPLDMLQ